MTPINQQTWTNTLKPRNFEKTRSIKAINFNSFQRNLINTLCYDPMRQQECLSFICHQSDITISHWPWKQQQIQAKSKNWVEKCEKKVSSHLISENFVWSIEGHLWVNGSYQSQDNVKISRRTNSNISKKMSKNFWNLLALKSYNK